MFDVSNEHSFHFKSTGERTKKVFEGGFKVKCLLSIEEDVEVGLRTDVYNRGSRSLDPKTGLLNRAVAELEIRILESPSWWKDSEMGRKLMDKNVLFELFNKALDAEKVYEERIAEADKKAEEGLEKVKKVVSK